MSYRHIRFQSETTRRRKRLRHGNSCADAYITHLATSPRTEWKNRDELVRLGLGRTFIINTPSHSQPRRRGRHHNCIHMASISSVHAANIWRAHNFPPRGTITVEWWCTCKVSNLRRSAINSRIGASVVVGRCRRRRVRHLRARNGGISMHLACSGPHD